MKSFAIYLLGFLCLFTSFPRFVSGSETQKPNFLIILCDDLGIGDVQCFNPKNGKIKTPNIDRLAKQGMSFTDAHSGSSVCTPTRYGLLTGRYCWRTPLQKGVASGFGPSIISADRMTLGKFFQGQGYDTAAIGKWHLNMKFMDPADSEKELDGKPLKFTAPVGATSPDGPTTRGFDYFYGIHHARSMKSVLENDVVIKHDDPINFLPATETKAVEYLQKRRDTKKPFFLYLPLSSPHTPIVPTKRWQGASGLGAYADFVMQTDDVVGQVIKCLEKEKLADNTIVIFASDNGCSRQAKINQLKQKGHLVSAGFRGSKSDIWEGGHRVPFIATWPGVIQPNSKCEQIICLTDLFATVAGVLDVDIPAGTCEDSLSFESALRGKPVEVERTGVIHHSISGHFAYRTKEWKLLLARGSGGWSHPTENKVSKSAPKGQLYDFTNDPQETNNLFEAKPAVVEKLLESLKRDIAAGRSTKGPKSKNDVESIELWKTKAK